MPTPAVPTPGSSHPAAPQSAAPVPRPWWTAFGDAELDRLQAQADVDKQVAFFESKFKVADLKDPKKLGDLVKRFTSLWEINNQTSTAQSATSVLYGQSAAYGISTDLMLTMQRMKF